MSTTGKYKTFLNIEAMNWRNNFMFCFLYRCLNQGIRVVKKFSKQSHQHWCTLTIKYFDKDNRKNPTCTECVALNPKKARKCMVSIQDQKLYQFCALPDIPIEYHVKNPAVSHPKVAK